MIKSIDKDANASEVKHSQNHVNFDFNLEGLRGFVALLVVLGHILTNNFLLDPNYRISGMWQYTPPGHLGVLVFFALSGYVIGLTNRKPIINNAQRKSYLKKRLVRLYPLYLLAIVLAVAVLALVGHSFDLSQIIIHLLFGQVLFAPVINDNQPLWSLNYEVIYYLGFLVISRFQINPLLAAIFCLCMALIARFLPGLPPVIVSYSCGACFWLVGLAISSSSSNAKHTQHGLLLAWLFLILCYERMNLGYSVLVRTGIDFNEQQVPSLFQHIIGFADLSYLLFCVPLLLRFTNKKIIGLVWLEFIAFIIPGLYLISYVISGKIADKNLFDTLVIAAVFYIIAICIYVAGRNSVWLGKHIIDFLIPLGSISYGVYIIHFPLIFVFQKIPFFTGSAGYFILRCSLYLALVLSIGWILERRFQPWVKSKIA